MNKLKNAFIMVFVVALTPAASHAGPWGPVEDGWTAVFDGPGTNNNVNPNVSGVVDDIASGIKKAPGGGVFVGGYTASPTDSTWDFMVIKYGPSSNQPQWVAIDGFPGETEIALPENFAIDSFGNPVLASNISNVDGVHGWKAVKFFADGTTAWLKKVEFWQADFGPNGMAVDPSGNVILGGFAWICPSEPCAPNYTEHVYGFVLVKLNAGTGAREWTTAPLPFPNSYDFKFATDPSGNVYVLSGQRIVKVNPAGAMVWSKDFASGSWSIPGGFASDNSALYLGAATTGGFKIKKIDFNGISVWEKDFATPNANPAYQSTGVNAMEFDGAGIMAVATGRGLAKIQVSDGAQIWSAFSFNGVYGPIHFDPSGNIVAREFSGATMRDGAGGWIIWEYAGSGPHETDGKLLYLAGDGSDVYVGGNTGWLNDGYGDIWTRRLVPPPDGDAIDSKIDTEPTVDSQCFTDGPSICNSPISPIGGTTSGRVVTQSQIVVVERPFVGVYLWSLASNAKVDMKCFQSNPITFANPGDRLSVDCRSLDATAGSENSGEISILAGAPYNSEGPTLNIRLSGGKQAVLNEILGGVSLSGSAGDLVDVLEGSGSVLATVSYSAYSNTEYTNPSDSIVIKPVTGSVTIAGKDGSSVDVGAGVTAYVDPTTGHAAKDSDADGILDENDTEGPVGSNDCSDGFDNDGDGFIDAADPQCTCPGAYPTITINTIGKGQSSSQNAKLSHAITGHIIGGAAAYGPTAARIKVCEGTAVSVSVTDAVGTPALSALSTGLICSGSTCSTAALTATEKYKAVSSDGKDTDRMTLLPAAQ